MDFDRNTGTREVFYIPCQVSCGHLLKLGLKRSSENKYLIYQKDFSNRLTLKEEGSLCLEADGLQSNLHKGFLYGLFGLAMRKESGEEMPNPPVCPFKQRSGVVEGEFMLAEIHGCC